MTFDSLLAGVKFVWKSKLILGVTTLDLFAVLLGGATALLPIYAKDILHVGPTGLGLLRSAPAVGAGLVALWLSYRPLGKRQGLKVFVCVFIFGICTIIFGLSKSPYLSFAALLIMGGVDLVSVVFRQAVVQLATPPAMRGRVSAVNTVFIMSSNELGQFESGVTAALWGPVGAVVAGGLGTCLIVLIWAKVFPQLLKVDDYEDLKAVQSG